MTRTITHVSKKDAEEILRSVYEAQPSACYIGNWQTKRHVAGDLVVATYNRERGAVVLRSNALGNASLKGMVPKRFRW